MEIPDPPKTCPHVNKMTRKGAYFGSSDRKLLNGQRMGNNSIKIRSWYRCPESEPEEMLERLGKKGTLDNILQRYAAWAPEALEFLKQADLNTLKHWTIYELPVGSTWKYRTGLTLIGDAASLMSPFGGEGVNKAMRDSLELAAMTVKSQDLDEELTLDKAVLLYENEMFPRAKKCQTSMMLNKELAFGEDAPVGLMTGMLKSMASESPSVLIRALGTPPVLAAVFPYFWVRQQIGWAIRRFWRRI
jgi:2-polyprenyl-6-methoxyphenol hydroxylase-like FAD-dependent oxidoreductase